MGKDRYEKRRNCKNGKSYKGGIMNELKPCPFCGGEAELLIVPANSGLSGTKWVVVCKKGCCNQYPHISDHDAIEAWNRRPGKQDE